jgi:hypothetical protein
MKCFTSLAVAMMILGCGGSDDQAANVDSAVQGDSRLNTDQSISQTDGSAQADSRPNLDLYVSTPLDGSAGDGPANYDQNISTVPDGGVQGDGAANHGLTISGPVDSEVNGNGQTAVLIWEVSSGSPDYAYKFGEGTIANGRLSITLADDPPAEALNSYGVGVAFVMVLPPGQKLADGKLPKGAISASNIIGMSVRHSVIWRAKSLPANVPTDFWPVSFPAGYSCGACTPRPDGGSFEGFAPAPCDTVRITTYDKAAMCNWT